MECCCLSCVKTVKKTTYNTHVGKAIKWENALPLCKALRGASSQRALLFFLCHCLCPHFIVFRNTRTKLTRRLITTKENIISIHEKEKSSNRFAKTIFEKPDCDTRYPAQCHASRLKIEPEALGIAGAFFRVDGEMRRLLAPFWQSFQAYNFDFNPLHPYISVHLLQTFFEFSWKENSLNSQQLL